MNGLCTFDGATGEQLISQLRVHSQSRDDDALAEMNIDYSNNAPVPTTISLLPTARYQYAPGTRLFLDMYEPALGSAASDIPMLM